MPDMNLTKLEAVNRILRAAREHPVSSLTTGSTNDSLLAEQILDDVLTREQMTGLHVNQTEAAFTRGSDNKILLPSNTLAVKGWNQHVFKNYYHKEVDGEVLLFDADNQPATSDFSSNGADEATAYLRITWRATFDELPSAYQFSIVDQAAVEYQESVLGDPGLGTKLEQRAGRSRAVARAYDMRARPNNQMDDGRSSGPRWGNYVQRSWPYNDLRRQ
tara:strand:+ start:1822 stop:2475 length:654 start_codon:yes stop_codon:yes gene_type:complete